MFELNTKRISVALILLALVALPVMSKSRKTQRLAVGAWGGPNIRINVTDKSATVDYACAHGTISGPLTINRNGTFSWRGFHTPERPGPIRVDGPSTQQPALYTGTVKGDTLTLTVKLANSNDLVDTFTLTRGGKGRVFKCK